MCFWNQIQMYNLLTSRTKLLYSGQQKYFYMSVLGMKCGI